MVQHSQTVAQPSHHRFVSPLPEKVSYLHQEQLLLALWNWKVSMQERQKINDTINYSSRRTDGDCGRPGEGHVKPNSGVKMFSVLLAPMNTCRPGGWVERETRGQWRALASTDPHGVFLFHLPSRQTSIGLTFARGGDGMDRGNCRGADRGALHCFKWKWNLRHLCLFVIGYVWGLIPTSCQALG